MSRELHYLPIQKTINEVDKHFVFKSKKFSHSVCNPWLDNIHTDLRNIDLNAFSCHPVSMRSQSFKPIPRPEYQFRTMGKIKPKNRKRTKCSNSGWNFCDFISFACLLENLVSWSAVVPYNEQNTRWTADWKGKLSSEISKSARGVSPGRTRPTFSRVSWGGGEPVRRAIDDGSDFRAESESQQCACGRVREMKERTRKTLQLGLEAPSYNLHDWAYLQFWPTTN